jgi:hypothetical protein
MYEALKPEGSSEDRFSSVDASASVRLGLDIKLTDMLVIPDRNAVILTVPATTVVAEPEETVVISVLELVQMTSEVISLVEPSEYMPAAVNC